MSMLHEQKYFDVISSLIGLIEKFVILSSLIISFDYLIKKTKNMHDLFTLHLFTYCNIVIDPIYSQLMQQLLALAWL